MNSSFTAKNKSREELKEIQHLVDYLLVNPFMHPLINYACNELGIDKTLLIMKKFHEIEDKSVTKEVNELRYQHLEARRKARIHIIAEFLVAHKMQRLNQNKTPSPGKSEKSLMITSATQEVNIDKKIIHLKNQMIHKLSVEENLKRIKIAAEESRKLIESKIKEKEKREKLIHTNARNFELRDKRIKERIEKKVKDIEAHELEALKTPDRSVSEMRFYSKTSPSQKFYRVTPAQSPDDSVIEAQLSLIENKLSQSTERAKKILLQKVASGNNISSHFDKVRSNRAELLNKEEEAKLQMLMKIKQDLQTSNKRKDEQMSLLKKLNRSDIQLKKKFEVEKIFLEKVAKESEMKDLQIEKVRREIKEQYGQKASLISEKIILKKKDQEENFERILMKKQQEKNRLLKKIREKEAQTRGKTDVDIAAVKAQVTKEFNSFRL